MSERLRLDSMMFMPELLGAVMRSMRQGQTVTPCSYSRQDDYALEIEIRVTKVNDLRLPATRRPTHEKVFKDQVVELNARDFLKSKGARRRSAAPDRARSRRSKR